MTEDPTARPMSPPDQDTFADEHKAGGNFRIAVRGRGGVRGKHRHTQSSAAVMIRSAYSTGSLAGAIQHEYNTRGGSLGKFMPLAPPDDEQGGARSRDWESVGAQILGGAMPAPDWQRISPRTPVKPRHSFNLGRLDTDVDGADPLDEANHDGIMPARESLVNKFAQEIMRSYPAELAATLGLYGSASKGGSSSPSHRAARTNFTIEDLDTSSWITFTSDEQNLRASITAIRESAARSIQAYRRSKANSPEHQSPSNSAALAKETKELETELINALQHETKGLRNERQRMEVRYSRLKEKNGALTEQMRTLKEELDQLKAMAATSGEKHGRRDSMAGSPKNSDSKEEETAADSEATNARIVALETEVQEKALALKSVRKQFVDVLIKQQRAEKINVELQNELEGEKTKLTDVTDNLATSEKELGNLREVLQERQQQLDDKTEEVDTIRMDHEREKTELTSRYDAKITALEETIRRLQSSAATEKTKNASHQQINAENLVKQMGQMLKEAIEKSTAKSAQVENEMNASGGSATIDTSDMFKCSSCQYINASIRLICANCGTKRFAALRSEKHRKSVRRQWVNCLVNMYLNMLDEILKTPRGEKVVQGEAQHSNKSGGAITTEQIRAAEKKIQVMLESAASQKGKQKFSEVYPKMESSGASESAEPAQPMRRAVKSVINANRLASPRNNENKGRFNTDSRPPRGSEPLHPGDLVYAKWHGPDREKYPNWYQAEIADVVHEDSYVVKYQTGTLCRDVPRVDIRIRSKAEARAQGR